MQPITLATLATSATRLPHVIRTMRCNCGCEPGPAHLLLLACLHQPVLQLVPVRRRHRVEQDRALGDEVDVIGGPARRVDDLRRAGRAGPSTPGQYPLQIRVRIRVRI